MTPRVDAHHHVWTLARGDYGWLRPGMAIYRDYSLDDLRPLLGDISATVLVQAAPSEAETQFMLDVARGSGGLVQAVVGWTDFATPDAPARIAALARDGMLRGLRPMLHDIPDPGWILQPDMDRAIAALIEQGLRFDALVRPVHLKGLHRLLQRHPTLPVVIDHCAKPAIASGAWQDWADDIARLANETGAFCKLSGLLTEAGEDRTAARLHPYAAHVLACFSPARVMWGSDWPVVDLAGGYQHWLRVTDQLLAGLSAPARDDVLGGTAARFYGLEGGGTC